MDAAVSALLQPTVWAPSVARNWVDGLPLDVSARTDLKLLTHEVVSNSVQHAGMNPKDPIRLNVYLGPGWARVEVWDTGPGFSAEPTPPHNSAERGRGLLVLDKLSDRWGVQSGECTCVWFEIDLPSDALPPSRLPSTSAEELAHTRA